MPQPVAARASLSAPGVSNQKQRLQVDMVARGRSSSSPGFGFRQKQAWRSSCQQRENHQPAEPR